MNESEKKPLKKFADSAGPLGPFMTWGWQFALTLGFLSWFGHWLDEKYETKVLFVLTGVFIGLLGGFVNLYRMISNLPKPKQSKREDHTL